MAINVGGTVRVQQGPHTGEVHTVERVLGSLAWIPLYGLPDASLGTSPYPIKYLTKLDAPTFNVGDRVTDTVGSMRGESATVVGMHRHWVKVRMDSRPDDVRYYRPLDLENLTKIDAGTFKVGDRVMRTNGLFMGLPARVVAVDGPWVEVEPESKYGPHGRYEEGSFKLVESEFQVVATTEFDLPLVDTETVTRVVAVFQSPKAPEIDMTFTDASAADVWIDHLKSAPGVAAVTVTRDTTETFTRNNA